MKTWKRLLLLFKNASLQNSSYQRSRLVAVHGFAQFYSANARQHILNPLFLFWEPHLKRKYYTLMLKIKHIHKTRKILRLPKAYFVPCSDYLGVCYYFHPMSILYENLKKNSVEPMFRILPAILWKHSQGHFCHIKIKNTQFTLIPQHILDVDIINIS